MQREVYPYIVYHILSLCTSAFWRFGNPACMIFILFKSFRFALAKKIHICVSSVPRTIVYSLNVYPLFVNIYRFAVYFLIPPFLFFSSQRSATLMREQQYSRPICIFLHCLCVYIHIPSLYNGKNPPRICTFSATSTGGFSHFGAITPLRLRCVRRNSRGGSGRGVRRPTHSAATA